MIETNYTTFSKKIVIILLVFLGFSKCIFALSSDESQAIHITANSGEANGQSQTTTLIGNVVISRGSILVHANRGTVSQDTNNDKIVTLWGTPITFSQKQDDGSVVTGQCNKFDYNTKTNLAILTGRARLNKGKDQLTGETITYNTKTQEYSANGLTANGVNSKKKSGKITIILDNIEKQNAK